MSLKDDTQDFLGKRKRASSGEEDKEEVGSDINLDSDASDDLDDLDDMDESEDEAGEGTGVVEYYEDCETLPDCAAYDKDFAQVGQNLLSIAKAALHLLRHSGCNNSRVQGLERGAEELTHIPQVKCEKIALLGNTGAGKSSLINSLLGLPNIAKAVDSGQSCTYIGTEYQRPFSGQTKRFAARVEYFDISAIRKLLQRMLAEYHMWNFEYQDDWDEDEKQELNRLSRTAYTTFRSLFCDKREFESPRASDNFLETAYHEGRENALDTFVEWCKALLEEKEADEADHMEYLDADSQEKFLAELDPLVSFNSKLDKPTLWPLVKQVRIGIEGPRILSHITLVDLPGLDDTNMVRVNASLDIMRSCESIWVVTKIGRAITDSSVDSLLMRYGKAFKMVVICTCVDEHIDDALATHLESQGQSIGNHQELLKREKDLRQRVRILPKKIENRRAKLEGRCKAKGRRKQKSLDDEAKCMLQTQIDQFKTELEVAEKDLQSVAQERFELLVDTRNANVIRRLKEEKSDHLPAGKTLDVFCVSNVHYASLKGASIVDGPRLNATMTGIPALRKYVAQLAAPAILQAMEYFIGHQFTVFMSGLAIWAKRHAVNSSQELLEIVKKPQSRVDGIIQAFHDDVVDAIGHTINKPLLTAQAELVRAATGVLNQKRAWHWSTMRAFIRKDGKHCTSVVTHQSWNEQFLAGATKIVDENWEDCLLSVQKSVCVLQQGLLDLVEGLLKDVLQHPAQFVLPTDRVRYMMAAQRKGVEKACQEHQIDFVLELNNINLDTKHDRYSGYFTQAMCEVYEKCKEDSGFGVKDRTFNTFATHLTLAGKRSPFALLCKKLSQAISRDTKAKGKELARKVQRILSDVYARFDDMVDEKIRDHAEEDLRNKFQEFLKRNEPMFEVIKADLEAVKQKHGG